MPGSFFIKAKPCSELYLGKPTHLQHLSEIPKAPRRPTFTKLAVALRQIPVLAPGHTARQAGTLSRLGFPIWVQSNTKSTGAAGT